MALYRIEKILSSQIFRSAFGHFKTEYMPYRRLPNTDKSRLKALRTALEKGKELPPFKLAYSQNSLSQLQSFIHSFDQALSTQRQNYSYLVDNNQQFRDAQKKARMYISHFIQVMNLAKPPETMEILRALNVGVSESMGVTGPILFDDYGDVKHYPMMFLVNGGQVLSYQRYLEAERRRIINQVQDLLTSGD